MSEIDKVLLEDMMHEDHQEAMTDDFSIIDGFCNFKEDSDINENKEEFDYE